MFIFRAALLHPLLSQESESLIYMNGRGGVSTGMVYFTQGLGLSLAHCWVPSSPSLPTLENGLSLVLLPPKRIILKYKGKMACDDFYSEGVEVYGLHIISRRDICEFVLDRWTPLTHGPGESFPMRHGLSLHRIREHELEGTSGGQF